MGSYKNGRETSSHFKWRWNPFQQTNTSMADTYKDQVGRAGTDSVLVMSCQSQGHGHPTKLSHKVIPGGTDACTWSHQTDTWI